MLGWRNPAGGEHGSSPGASLPRDARAVRWGLWDDSAQSGSTGAGLRDLEEKVSLRKEVSFNIHLLVYVLNYRKTHLYESILL